MLSFCCAQAISQQSNQRLLDAQRVLKNIAKHPDIEWIEVACITFTVDFATMILPNDFDRHSMMFSYSEKPNLQTLRPALLRTKLESAGGGYDSKLAVTFYDAKKTRLGKIYMNHFGMAGYIDSTPVVFEETSGDIYDWLSKNSPECFEGSFYRDRQERILQKQQKNQSQK